MHQSSSTREPGNVRPVAKVLVATTAMLTFISFSTLMFDYILTGPISGVAAGRYLAGLINELLPYAHVSSVVNPGLTATLFALAITAYFWWQNIKGIPESSHKALRIMQFTTV